MQIGAHFVKEFTKELKDASAKSCTIITEI